MTGRNDELDDAVEKMLQQPYIEDAGFTQRVVGALPRRRSRLSRGAILRLSTVAAAAVLALGPGRSAAHALFSGRVDASGLVPLLLSVLVVATTAVSALLCEAER